MSAWIVLRVKDIFSDVSPASAGLMSPSATSLAAFTFALLTSRLYFGHGGSDCSRGFMEGNIGLGRAQMRNGSLQSCRRGARSARSSKPYIITAKHNNRFVNRRCHRTSTTINYNMTWHNKIVTRTHETAERHTDESGRVGKIPQLHRS